MHAHQTQAPPGWGHGGPYFPQAAAGGAHPGYYAAGPQAGYGPGISGPPAGYGPGVPPYYGPGPGYQGPPPPGAYFGPPGMVTPGWGGVQGTGPTPGPGGPYGPASGGPYGLGSGAPGPGGPGDAPATSSHAARPLSVSRALPPLPPSASSARGASLQPPVQAPGSPGSGAPGSPTGAPNAPQLVWSTANSYYSNNASTNGSAAAAAGTPGMGTGVFTLPGLEGPVSPVASQSKQLLKFLREVKDTPWRQVYLKAAPPGPIPQGIKDCREFLTMPSPNDLFTKCFASLRTIMKDTLSLFLFVVVIVMATAAGGEAVPSKYYGMNQLLVTISPLVMLLFCSLAKIEYTCREILYYELFCNRVIVLFDPPATLFRRIPKTRTGYAAAVTAVYIVGMIGYYSSKGVIHGLSHLAVLKIFLDSRCFLTYLNGDVYGFASTLHTVPTYIRGVIAKSADVSVVNTLRKVVRAMSRRSVSSGTGSPSAEPSDDATGAEVPPSPASSTARLSTTQVWPASPAGPAQVSVPAGTPQTGDPRTLALERVQSISCMQSEALEYARSCVVVRDWELLWILANKVVDHHYQKPSALYVAREEVEVALASLWAAPVATQEAVRTFHNKLNRGSLAFSYVVSFAEVGHFWRNLCRSFLPGAVQKRLPASMRPEPPAEYCSGIAVGPDAEPQLERLRAQARRLLDIKYRMKILSGMVGLLIICVEIYGFMQATKPDPCKTAECTLNNLVVGCVPSCPAGMTVSSSCT